MAPYELAARLADLLLGVTVSAMGVWRVTQRLGQAAASYSEALSRYHADSRSQGAPVENAPRGCQSKDADEMRFEGEKHSPLTGPQAPFTGRSLKDLTSPGPVAA